MKQKALEDNLSAIFRQSAREFMIMASKSDENSPIVVVKDRLHPWLGFIVHLASFEHKFSKNDHLPFLFSSNFAMDPSGISTWNSLPLGHQMWLLERYEEIRRKVNEIFPSFLPIARGSASENTNEHEPEFY